MNFCNVRPPTRTPMVRPLGLLRLYKMVGGNDRARTGQILHDDDPVSWNMAPEMTRNDARHRLEPPYGGATTRKVTVLFL